MKPFSARALMKAAPLLMAAAFIVFAFGAGAAQNAQKEKEPAVYVKESTKAADTFELARRMERLKEWHKAADAYQEILEDPRCADSVVPTVFDTEQRPLKYEGFGLAVRDRLCAWPLEGLTVYRARFEPAAAALLQKAGSTGGELLREVLNRYFVTVSAVEAAIRLIDLSLEAGDFAEAAWIGDLLLQKHPGLEAQRPAVLFRTAIAHHLAGAAALAAARLEELKKAYPTAWGTVAGRDVNLVEALQSVLQSRPPTATAGSSDSWRTFGGDATRNLLTAGGGKAGARVYSIAFPPPAMAGLNEQQKQQRLAALAAERSLGLTTGVMPAVDRGEMFFQNGERIWAVHLESGVPLALWQQTYPHTSGQFTLPTAVLAAMTGMIMRNDAYGGAGGGGTPAQQHTITVTDDAVLAVMGRPASIISPYFAAGMAGGASSSRLVCLDRATGQLRWMVDPSGIGSAGGAYFSGAPLVVGDNVFVIARTLTNTEESCQLVCYRVDSGALRWSCFVASAPTGTPYWGGAYARSTLDTVSHLSFAGGRVFVLTNLGAVAAVDAASGRTAWMCVYGRDPAMAARMNQMRGVWIGGVMPAGPAATSREAIKPWEPGAPLVHEGKVFVLPLDGLYIHIYDAGTGQELKRIPRRLEYRDQTFRATMLLAVNGSTMLLSMGCDPEAPREHVGGDCLFVLDWQKAAMKEHGTGRIDEQAVLYVAPHERVWGRPFVTATHAYVPTRTALCIMDLQRKRIVERVPPGGGQWPEDQGPGNVVVTQNHLVIAGAANVSVYTDLHEVQQKYLAAIAADPANLDARLVYAELMFNARQTAEAAAAIDQTIQLLGGAGKMRSGPARDRVFADCLLFAQKLSAAGGAANIAMAEKFYDRAASAADTPAQHVSYRMSRAKHIETMREEFSPDYAMAVRLYQEVIADARMRRVTLGGEEGSAIVQAGRVAEAAIDRIVGRRGASLYQPFEQEAAARLKELLSVERGDPARLLELAETYPNATATAATAMTRAAEEYDRQGRPREASQVLKRLYWKYSSRFSAEEKTRLLESMARNCLRWGNESGALGRLERIASAGDATLSAPLPLRDGRELAAGGKPVRTAKAAVEALRRMLHEQSQPALPDVRLPPLLSMQERLARKVQPPAFAAPTEQATVAGVQAVVAPPDRHGPGARFDRLVAWAENRLLCYSAPEHRLEWSSDVLSQQPAALYWRDDRLLLWTDDQIVMLDGNRGSVVWKSALTALPVLEVVHADMMGEQLAARSDAKPAPDAGRARVEARQVVELRGNVLIADAAGLNMAAAGLPVAAGAPDGRERIARVRVLTDRVMVLTSAARTFALAIGDGALLWQTRLASGRTVQEMLCTEDFAAVRLAETGAVWFVVLDCYTGQQVLRKVFRAQEGPLPLAMALSPEGTLVWTTQQTIAARDLYEPGESPSWEQRSQNRNYNVSGAPAPIVIRGHDVLVLCDGGRFIERRHLRTGEIIGNPLNTNSRDAGVVMCPIGSRLYVISASSLLTYHLDDSASPCEAKLAPGVRALPADAMITGTHTILPALLTETAADQPATYVLQAFSRAMVKSIDGRMTESARQEHCYQFVEPAKVKTWAAVTGGIYYLSGEDKLYFLRGNAP